MELIINNDKIINILDNICEETGKCYDCVLLDALNNYKKEVV